jgi:glutamate-1-semialdehyde 2,1-aminomutase
MQRYRPDKPVQVENSLKTIAIVQARLSSTRLPNKVLKEIGGVPLIGILIDRLSRSSKIDNIVLAIPDNEKNQALADYADSCNITCFRGSENDVLDRFYQAAINHKADTYIRITGDCPLVDAGLVDECLDAFQEARVDYLSNISPPSYPDGLDIEIFTFEALARTWEHASGEYNREHVTPYMRDSGKFKTANKTNNRDLSALRWTVDEASDFSVVESIFSHFMPVIDFSWEQVLEFQESNPDIFEINSSLIRNQGANMGSGQKLWKRAKQIIPGGNMLLSKRAEMFLPEHWPAYFCKAKGCRVWDMDDNQFIDMSIMGIGTNILGYGHPDVDDAVRGIIDTGNMSTFNCPEEVFLAEKLVELHPWANMVRFTRSGGEANAVAIRIARAASGRDKVAICGYHGWHDWYLSANLGDDKNLDGHLMPGLEPSGVPRNLKGTVLPFSYNNFVELEALVSANKIGVIKMEVERNLGPEDNFLHKVRKLATENNIVLIFDECTSGFRETFGGLHKKYGVEPDMAIFGKALGNGYGIASIIGRREIMEAAQSTFISSTFWTERIGSTAALKTLEIMEKVQSWETITKTGLQIRERWKQLAAKYNLKINHWGLPALTGYTFQSSSALAYKTLISQEMLAKSYLASNCVYVCIEHTADVVDGYFNALEPIFGLIKECEDGRDVMALLKGPVCHGGFKRLN